MYILKSGPDHELHRIRADAKDSGRFFFNLFLTDIYTYKYLL